MDFYLLLKIWVKILKIKGIDMGKDISINVSQQINLKLVIKSNLKKYQKQLV